MASQANSRIRTTVARNIRAARQSKGLTQRELARLVNSVDTLAVSRWERGVTAPAETNLQALAHATGRDVAWFYTDHDLPTAA